MFLIPITLLTVILNAVSLLAHDDGSSILVPLAAMWGFAAIGAIDDWEGRGPRRGLGMRGKTKFLLQCLWACDSLCTQGNFADSHLLGQLPYTLNLGWFTWCGCIRYRRLFQCLN